LPPKATIMVIAKEVAVHNDQLPRKRDVFKSLGTRAKTACPIVREACWDGFVEKGVPRARSDRAVLAEHLQQRSDEVRVDGFVRICLPLDRDVGGTGEVPEAPASQVTFQVRWRDYDALRSDWLGSQELSPAPAESRRAVPVCHRKDSEAIYDLLDWRQLAEMEKCDDVLRVWKDWYEDDPLFDDGEAGDAPPIRRVVSMHGINVPTELIFAVRLNTTRIKPGRTRFELDDEAELVEPCDSFMMSGGIIYEKADQPGSLSGDGVVPRHSLRHCDAWKDQLRLKTIQFDKCEHRPMLAHKGFHAAVIEALTENTVDAAREMAGADNPRICHPGSTITSPRGRSELQGKWTVGCWDGPLGVKFHTYESEDEAREVFGQYTRLGAASRILFDTELREVKRLGWNSLALSAIADAFHDPSKEKGSSVEHQSAPKGEPYWTVATQEGIGHKNFRFYTYSTEEEAEHVFKYFDNFGATSRILFDDSHEELKRAGWNPVVFKSIARAYHEWCARASDR